MNITWPPAPTCTRWSAAWTEATERRVAAAAATEKRMLTKSFGKDVLGLEGDLGQSKTVLTKLRKRKQNVC